MTAQNGNAGDHPIGRDLREPLELWLSDKLPGSGPVRVGHLSKPGAGLSAGTLLFEATRNDGGREETHELVVRMPPPKERALFPDGDLARELEIQTLLSAAGVPVAPVVGLETDPTLIGGPFFVTRRVKGRLVDSNDPYMSIGWLHDSSPDFQHQLATGYMTVLADIHRVPVEDLRGTRLCEPEKIGLGAALDRWSSYLKWADDDAAPDSLYEALEWCVENRPSPEPPDALLWGDAQLANAVFDDQGQTAAVLDFELSAIGPSEVDLGWFFCLHDMTVARCGEDLPGFADRPGLIAHYEEHLGRHVYDLAWYEIFAAVCTASILVRMSQLMSNDGVDLSWLARTNPALDYLASRIG